MKINALKMQILMGEQNLTIKELAGAMCPDKQFPVSSLEKAALHRLPANCQRH